MKNFSFLLVIVLFYSCEREFDWYQDVPVATHDLPESFTGILYPSIYDVDPSLNASLDSLEKYLEGFKYIQRSNTQDNIDDPEYSDETDLFLNEKLAYIEAYDSRILAQKILISGLYMESGMTMFEEFRGINLPRKAKPSDYEKICRNTGLHYLIDIPKISVSPFENGIEMKMNFVLFSNFKKEVLLDFSIKTTVQEAYDSYEVSKKYWISTGFIKCSILARSILLNEIYIHQNFGQNIQTRQKLMNRKWANSFNEPPNYEVFEIASKLDTNQMKKDFHHGYFNEDKTKLIAFFLTEIENGIFRKGFIGTDLENSKVIGLHQVKMETIEAINVDGVWITDWHETRDYSTYTENIDSTRFYQVIQTGLWDFMSFENEPSKFDVWNIRSFKEIQFNYTHLDSLKKEYPDKIFIRTYSP